MRPRDPLFFICQVSDFSIKTDFVREKTKLSRKRGDYAFQQQKICFMPKTPSPHLFELIHSMSGSEKRYFKLFVQADEEGEKKYMQLFEAIEKQDEFNDEALSREVYGDEPVQSRKYSELKAYLYQQLLRSLQAYDERSSVDFRLKVRLQSVRVLYHRSLFDQALLLLTKIKRLAYRYEHFLVIVEALRWEKQIAYARMDVSYLHRRLREIDEEERECLERMRNFSEYRKLFFRLLLSGKQEAYLRTKEKVRDLKKMMDHPLLADPGQALSHKALVTYWRIFNIYYFSVLDYERFYTSGRRLIELMEKEPHLLREDVSEYIAALSNLTLACGLRGAYKEVGECLEKFREIKPITRDDELKIHRQYYNTKFAFCIATGDFEEGHRAFLQHRKELRRFGRDQFDQSAFLSQYFMIHFGIGDYDQAMDYLSQWIAQPRNTARQDLQAVARIVLLILHYEMGNQQLLQYLMRSTYRALKRQDRLHRFEQSVLKFMQKSLNTITRSALRQAFAELKEEFEALQQIPSERVLFQYFDFIAWLDSQIAGKSFAEAVRARYLQEKK